MHTLLRYRKRAEGTDLCRGKHEIVEDLLPPSRQRRRRAVKRHRQLRHRFTAFPARLRTVQAVVSHKKGFLCRIRAVQMLPNPFDGPNPSKSLPKAFAQRMGGKRTASVQISLHKRRTAPICPCFLVRNPSPFQTIHIQSPFCGTYTNICSHKHSIPKKHRIRGMGMGQQAKKYRESEEKKIEKNA